jgi:hypothetical protein
MGESLSKRLNFRVNKYPILLNKDLNVPVMGSHGIEQAGFWARILLRGPHENLCSKRKP